MLLYDRTVTGFILTYARDEDGLSDTARVSFVYDGAGSHDDIEAAYAPLGANLVNYLNRKSLFPFNFPRKLLQKNIARHRLNALKAICRRLRNRRDCVSLPTSS